MKTKCLSTSKSDKLPKIPYFYKFKSFIDIDKIYWSLLSGNPAAIHLLVVAEQQSLCAKRIVEDNSDKIDWRLLSGNPAAIHLLVIAVQQ